MNKTKLREILLNLMVVALSIAVIAYHYKLTDMTEKRNAAFDEGQEFMQSSIMDMFDDQQYERNIAENLGQYVQPVPLCRTFHTQTGDKQECQKYRVIRTE